MDDRHVCRNGVAMAGQALKQVWREYADTVGLEPSADPFQRSMLKSRSTFYADLAANTAHVSQVEAMASIRICEAVPLDDAMQPPATAMALQADFAECCDFAILGGVGYIATAVARRALDQGRKVRILVRNPGGISDELHWRSVELVVGDIKDARALEAAIRGAKTVLDTGFPKGNTRMAHDIQELAELVAEACLDAEVSMLIYLGTIGSMKMRDGEVISGCAPVDPRIADRNDYARGEALAERKLFALREGRGLPLCVMRPGIVVGGSNAPPVNPAFGQLRNGRHMSGMAASSRALPWVLVDDVASAILGALGRTACIDKTYNLVSDCRLSIDAYVSP